jgi:hypothetical protein
MPFLINFFKDCDRENSMNDYIDRFSVGPPGFQSLTVKINNENIGLNMLLCVTFSSIFAISVHYAFCGNANLRMYAGIIAGSCIGNILAEIYKALKK